MPLGYLKIQLFFLTSYVIYISYKSNGYNMYACKLIDEFRHEGESCNWCNEIAHHYKYFYT